MTASQTEERELMAGFGSTKVEHYRFHYRDWQYSNLQDAIAQARRDAAPASK